MLVIKVHIWFAELELSDSIYSPRSVWERSVVRRQEAVICMRTRLIGKKWDRRHLKNLCNIKIKILQYIRNVFITFFKRFYEIFAAFVLFEYFDSSAKCERLR